VLGRLGVPTGVALQLLRSISSIGASVGQVGNFLNTSSGLNGTIPHVLNPDDIVAMNVGLIVFRSSNKSFGKTSFVITAFCPDRLIFQLIKMPRQYLFIGP
jgi:hypothetical protein